MDIFNYLLGQKSAGGSGGNINVCGYQEVQFTFEILPYTVGGNYFE